MFGPFQKRLTTWFGRLKIDGGKLGGTADQSALEITQDWNTTGNPTLIKANATTGTVGSSAKLLDLQVGGMSCLSVDAYGMIRGKLGVGTAFVYGNTNLYLLTNSVSIQGNTAINGNITITGNIAFSTNTFLFGDVANTLAQRNATNAQESRLYATYTSATNYQRLSTKTIQEALTATAGATKTSTITIPAYSQLIGVTTRVTTALGTSNGTTGYQVGDGTDPDLWGAITGTAIGTTSDHNNFTAIDALGPSATARTITLTAVGGNFDGTGVIEICAFYNCVEAD